MLDSNRLRRLEQMPLWDFALAFYSAPNVEDACLTLQDTLGIDVCELLFHGWLSVHGLEALPGPLDKQRKEREVWQREVTQALRHLRRRLKPEAQESASIATLRKMIQQAELQAERENLQRWQIWATENPDDDARLTNCALNSHDVAKWLQDRLHFTELDKDCLCASGARDSISNAWQALATRLDRFESPR
ncbi:TIGR02444 family protein [Vreelandella populi]|uniref:TIGR02444 family protein n=1 Tax=Vreelandella populi TaxID=2498858 RepID=A0A433LEZ1_9GAMM|nr:TIGR02444 family protein [Halomonas populi]RUR35608.1 TIGR02444 family protein [Halomonas populi]RUR47799.1 TIGR02444 family protein [Halomonas populi]